MFTKMNSTLIFAYRRLEFR